jgi:hypothetical protein
MADKPFLGNDPDRNEPPSQKQVNPHGQNRHDKAKHNPRGIAPDTPHSSKKTRRRGNLLWLYLTRSPRK